MLKIRWSHDRLTFNMGIPIPRKDSLYIETGPRLSVDMIIAQFFSIIVWENLKYLLYEILNTSQKKMVFPCTFQLQHLRFNMKANWVWRKILWHELANQPGSSCMWKVLWVSWYLAINRTVPATSDIKGKKHLFFVNQRTPIIPGAIHVLCRQKPCKKPCLSKQIMLNFWQAIINPNRNKFFVLFCGNENNNDLTDLLGFFT